MLKKLIPVNEGNYTRYICPGCGATLFTQNNTDRNPVPLSVDMFCKHCGTKVYYEETKEEVK